LTDLDWVKPALAALERGESLPLADLCGAFRLLSADPHVRRTTVPSYDGRHEHISQQRMAVPALWSAAAEDPLRAGLESLFHAIVMFGIDHRRLLSEVRGAFPGGRGVILAVAGVLGEPERLDDPQPHAAVV
jgi:hypothetical protein